MAQAKAPVAFRGRAAKLTPEEARQARLDRATLRRAWRFASPYHRLIVAFLGTMAASSIIAVLPPLVFKRLIDTALPARDLGLVNLLVGFAVALALGETAFRLLNRWLSSRIGEGLIYDLRTALYDHVQRMPIAFFTRTQTGSLLSRMQSDVVGAQGTVGTLATVTSDVFLLSATVGAMFLLNWQVTSFALLIVPAILVLDRVMSPRMVALSRDRMQLNGDLGATMAERFNVSGALLVKLFGRRAHEVATFSERARAVRDSGIRLAMTSRVYYASLTLMGALGTAGVYWVGSRAVVDGRLEVGGLVALAAYVARLYSPLTNLASARVDLLTSLVSFERCFEVLDAPHAITEKADAVDLPDGAGGRGEIEFDDVWFRYPAPNTVSIASLEAANAEVGDEPSDWVLRGISFRAEPGTMTALVGPSGAGKTTMSGLVPRLYDVTSGSVRIDGVDVRDATLSSLVASIGVVTQDPHLFHDSIAENLRYAKPDATDDELVEACRAARIHDLVAPLPAGYDTLVGERGYRMSGGEKQRLAIARVLLKDPAIVILDEATSHLDSETEALIQQALTEALSGRTSIVIAHRLSTIRAADQILVIERGSIVDAGRHGDLIVRGGLYRELYETQFAEAG
ncbi:MAG TPA: ABC transporter ATP-binding protein [Acidimicrobiales bacterium]|nr:ABC transporter ATP-binding protein [Acidimicrobiales bacterium]